jgi:uncharacterized protein YvpB
MKLVSLITGLSALCIITGCGSEETSDKSYKSSQVYQPGSNAPSNQRGISPVMNNAPITPNGMEPSKEHLKGSENIIPISTNIQPVQPANAVATSGLNPEHGKPGHRCDIAVGAPLNSKAPAPVVQNNPAPVTVQPTTISAPAVTSTKTVAKGLNPEHGQPGHRCDIAVGAPLDSKPTVTPSVTTAQPATNVTPMSVTPVLPAKTNATAPAYQPGGATAGLNPEHGKPGHRCDIAVGAPLNSKPAIQQSN